MDAAREQAMADSLTAIKTDLATMRTMLDLLIQRIDPTLIDHEQRIRALEQRPDGADHTDRIRELEKWQWQRDAGLALGSSGVGGVIVAVVNAMIAGG